MPYCFDFDFKPLTAAERRAMKKILDEIEEIIARHSQRTGAEQ